MIEQLPGFPETVLAFAARGRVHRDDYKSVLVPVVERALKTHERIRLYYELGSDFAGIDSGAMWEDFKVGVEHLTRWERAAVVTDVEWIRQGIRLFGFLMPGAMRAFPVSETQQARAWISAPA